MEILFLSFPVFYIIGLVTFIRWLVGALKSKSSQRIVFLENEITNLTQVVKKSPDKKVSDLLLVYVKELESLKNVKIEMVKVSQESVAPIASSTTKPTPPEEGRILDEEEVRKASLEEDLSKFWTNWYSDNSINLLLYIGAFLIVASASIFVGFQWETIEGSIKSSLLSLLTLAFFGFGFWFYNEPKIKNAGATFIAIAALLIPFNGAAWYNFVLEPSGYSIGGIWLITSLVAVVSYGFLAYFIRHPFYTYIAGFGGLSTVISIVNISNANQEFYVLGGIFSAFVLLLSTRIFANPSEEIKKSFTTPLAVSAHVIMPIFLVWGITLSAAAGQFFTLEIVVSTFMASLYYLLAYSFRRDVTFLTIGTFIFPISVFLFGKYLNLDILFIFIIIQTIAIGYLLISSSLNSSWKNEVDSLFTTSQVLLPLTLLLSIVSAVSTNDLFTFGLSVTTFLSVVFYSYSYYFKKDVGFIALAEILLLISVYITGRWLEVELIPLYYTLELLSVIYLFGGFYLHSYTRFKELSDSLTITSLGATAFLFFYMFGTGVDYFHITAFAAIATLMGLVAAYYKKENIYFFYNFIFLAITVYLYFNNLLDLKNREYLMGSMYVGISLIMYLITLSTRKIPVSFQSFTIATAGFSLLGVIFTIQEPGYFLFSNIVLVSIFLDAALRFNKYEFIYFSNLFIFVGIWSILRAFDVRLSHYPFFYAGAAYLFYTVSQILPSGVSYFYRITGLIGVGVNTLFFGMLGQSDPAFASHTISEPSPYQNPTPPEVRQIQPEQTTNELEKNALLSSYASFFLYSFDASTHKKAALGYFASVVGMLTYLWQMNYLGFTETQVYTLPIGVYFLTLAYIQRVKGSSANQDLLNYIGLFFLLIPTLFQSFGADGAQYALLLSFEGLILFAIGNSLALKTHIYAGIAAIIIGVVSQTYEFVFALPKWLITAFFGLLFLGTAIYLLLNRKEGPKQE